MSVAIWVMAVAVFAMSVLGAGVVGLGGATGRAGAGVAGRAGGVTSAKYAGVFSKAIISSLSNALDTNSLACFISAVMSFHFLAFAMSSNGFWIRPVRLNCFFEACEP